LPQVQVERIINEKPERVFELARDMEAFLDYMPNAREINTLERSAKESLTEWVVELKGMTFRWTERELFDAAKLKIYYAQTKGELREMKGEWTFEEHPQGTRVVMTNNFEFGMPAMAVVLNPVATIAIKDNLTRMLEALDLRARATDTGK